MAIIHTIRRRARRKRGNNQRVDDAVKRLRPPPLSEGAFFLTASGAVFLTLGTHTSSTLALQTAKEDV